LDSANEQGTIASGLLRGSISYTTGGSHCPRGTLMRTGFLNFVRDDLS